MDIKEKQAFDEYFKEKYPELYKDVFNEDGDERAIIGYSFALSAWQARAKAQAVPEGFVLMPTKNTKYFSHDGENYEVHDTLAEAKHEAECAVESFRERLADQLCNPAEDGNFSQVGYGIVLAESGYSVDHIVTQEDVDNGEYGYDVGTEIMSLFLIEAQEQGHE